MAPSTAKPQTHRTPLRSMMCRRQREPIRVLLSSPKQMVQRKPIHRLQYLARGAKPFALRMVLPLPSLSGWSYRLQITGATPLTMCMPIQASKPLACVANLLALGTESNPAVSTNHLARPRTTVLAKNGPQVCFDQARHISWKRATPIGAAIDWRLTGVPTGRTGRLCWRTGHGRTSMFACVLEPVS